MKKDFKNYSLHPTDEELADFIDKKLDEKEREEMLEHLIYCDDCSDIVFGVMEKQSAKQEESTKLVNDINQPQVANVDNQDYANNTDREPETTSQGTSVAGVGYANNWFYSKRVKAIVLSGLVASVVVIFMLSPFSSSQFNIGDIDLSKPIMTTMGSSSKYQNRVVDGDKIVKEIEESLDLTYIKSFLKAEEAEKRGNFKLALDLYYDNAFEEVLSTFEGEEQLKWKILIYYRISRINFQEGIEDNESYKNYTKEWLQEYILNK